MALQFLALAIWSLIKRVGYKFDSFRFYCLSGLHNNLSLGIAWCDFKINMKYSKKMYEELIPVIHNVWTLPSILQSFLQFSLIYLRAWYCVQATPSRFGWISELGWWVYLSAHLVGCFWLLMAYLVLFEKLGAHVF